MNPIGTTTYVDSTGIVAQAIRLNELSEPAIRVRNLRKVYGEIEAVRGIDLDVRVGEIFGLIGPDGAGKTSVFQILGGVMQATEGEATMLGNSARDARSYVGYLTQVFSLYHDLTVAENLRYMGELRRLSDEEIERRGRRYLEKFSMDRFMNRLARKLSRAEDLLDETAGIDDAQRFGDHLDVMVKYAARGEKLTRETLGKAGIEVEQIEVAAPTLENTFVAMLRHVEDEVRASPFPVKREFQKRQSDAIAIGARDLSKSFGEFEAVRRINLEVKYGEVYGLLGANGAGKTTTIKMLCGLLEATNGEAELAGETGSLRSSSVRQRVGYMSQKFSLYDDLTIEENLDFFAGVYQVPLAERTEKKRWVLSFSGLQGRGKQMTGSLPGGWKQRVAFGAAVMHEPSVLFLDEPTSGVDPLDRRAFG